MLKIGEYLEHRRTGTRLIIKAMERGAVLCELEQPQPPWRATRPRATTSRQSAPRASEQGRDPDKGTGD
jgi:hypothetical protein